MSLRVVQTPEARTDLALQAKYYAQKGGMALASRFAEAVKASVRLLAGHPWIGKKTDFRHPKLAGIRFLLVRKPFDKHLIFYRVHEDELDLVRIIHGMRDLPRRLLDPPGAE